MFLEITNINSGKNYENKKNKSTIDMDEILCPICMGCNCIEKGFLFYKISKDLILCVRSFFLYKMIL